MSIDYGSSTSSFTATINGQSAVFSATAIVIRAGDGHDSLNATLSSLQDIANVHGTGGNIQSRGYDISFAEVESSVLTGGGIVDIVTFSDPGLVCTAYLLPQYGILQSAGFSNQAIGFSHYIVDAAVMMTRCLYTVTLAIKYAPLRSGMLICSPAWHY